MEASGWPDLITASETVFDQTKASQYHLQAHPDDVTSVMIFNSDVAAGPWTVTGNNPDQLRTLYTNIKDHAPADGTNMYTCLNKAFSSSRRTRGKPASA